MITIEQIRGGRGLLGWSQEDLAKHTSLSKNAVNNVELQKVKPRTSTIERIQHCMEAAGVEFIEGPGVRLLGELLKVRMFEGEEALSRLWEDMYSTLGNGQERLLNGVQEKEYQEQENEQLEKFFNNCVKRNIKGRILLEHGDTNLIDHSSEYRWAQKDKFSNIPYYIYGDKYAILLWEPVKRVILIENATIAESYRAQFNALWHEATIIPEAYLERLHKNPDISI